MADLSAIGPELHQRWRNPLPEGQVVRLGRAPRTGWKVWWDPMISREHADLSWGNGKLRVHCLEMARNPVIVDGSTGDEFVLGVGESFRIGQTRFVISETPIDSAVVLPNIRLDKDSNILVDKDTAPGNNFEDAARRLELVMRLPSIIAETRSDEELAERLTRLLLEALPRVCVAATIRFEKAMDVETGKPPMIRWDARREEAAPFRPSMRLIRAAMNKKRGILHFFSAEENGASKYTVSEGVDWAICIPISTKGPDCWFLYVAGESDFIATPEALQSDLRFTSLMAQFIGSIRQVRQLEKIQAGMSQFFSPMVMDTLFGEFGQVLMSPRICDISVIFCDVRGFSRLAEYSGVDLFPLLNRVSSALGTMTRSIMKYDGVIADFQGDAALGFWGWPVAPDEGVIPACQAALAIHEGFCQARSNPGHPLCGFKIGIGLAHGRAIAGRIGSDEQAKVGVFGPVVNLGSRLEGMTKQFNVPILMDEACAVQVRTEMGPNEGRCRRLGQFYPYGMQCAAEVSELLPPPGSRSNLTDRHIADFESAVDCVEAGNWSQARALFERVPEDDGPRRFYLDFLSRFDDNPPEEWHGVISLTSK